MSKKIAIITDSNSGITTQLAKELGVFVIPMPFIIDGKTYYEDIDLTQSEFYKLLENDADISTSQPLVGNVTKLWDKVLLDYDEIVHIPMSSGLSGSCATAMALADDYDGRVRVVNNQRISVTQRQSVMDAIALAKSGKGADEIGDILENVKFESSIYIMMDTLKYLKKGGRITPAAAAIATVLRIRPILQIQGEKLDAFAKTRSEAQGRKVMLDAMQKDIETRFSGTDNVRIFVAHTNNEQAAIGFKQAIEEKFNTTVEFCDPLSLSVACHIGPGALAIACSKKLDPALLKEPLAAASV